jgi:flagellar biogenesis protein FliO
MKTLLAVVVILSFACLPAMCLAAGPDNAHPAATESGDRGAGYLPYSDPAPMGGGGLFGAILRTVFSLAVVLGLLYATLWLIRKVSGGAAGPLAEGAVRVVGRVYLSPKVAIYFIRLAGELLVVGVSSGAISLLTTLKDERQILEVEEALRNVHAYASGLPFSRFFDKSLGMFQKTREGNQSVLDDQLRMLNDHIGRLRGLTRRRREDDE